MSRRHEDGEGLVSFVIIFPLIVIVLAGVFSFFWMHYQRTAVEAQIGNISYRLPDDWDTMSTESLDAYVKAEMLSGSTLDSSRLTVSDVTVTDGTTVTNSGEMTTAQIPSNGATAYTRTQTSVTTKVLTFTYSYVLQPLVRFSVLDGSGTGLGETTITSSLKTTVVMQRVDDIWEGGSAS